MKIYTSVPRDLTRVKEKVLFNMTKRQIVCFGLAALAGVPLYFLLKKVADPTAATLGMVVIMIPMFLMAMYEKNGQPLEVLLQHYFRAKYFRKKNRPYQTERIFLKTVKEKKNRGHLLEMLQEGLPETAQQSITYEKMYKDGICKVSGNYYSKTIRFSDRNYQLLKEQEKESVLEEWGQFLKLFGTSVQLEMTFLSLPEKAEQEEKRFNVPRRFDHLYHLRENHLKVMKSHEKRGTHGLEEIRLLTFGLEAESLKAARRKLTHVEKEVLDSLEKLQVEAASLDGTERLEIMYRMMHDREETPFWIDWNYMAEEKLNTKDYIAPETFEFDEGRNFRMGKQFGAVSYLTLTASELDDEILKELLVTQSSQVMSIHMQNIDKATAIKMVKRTITEIDCSKIEEQKKAVKGGYDMDIIPTDLATYGNDARKLLNALQSEDESLLMVTFLIMNIGKTEKELEENVAKKKRLVQQRDCELYRLNCQQEQGFMSCLPLAYNQIKLQRVLTNSCAAIFIPFSEQEIQHEGGAAIYYGVDQLTKKLIIADRKRLKAPNALIVGSSGSGKSFKTKEEMTSVLLVTEDDVIVCDPEAEYRPVVEQLGGQVIRICATSHDYINPLDINMNYSEEDGPLALKAEFIMSFFEQVLGGSECLEAEEKSIIDRCIPKIYQKYFENPIPENMPILEDLYQEILKQEEAKAKRLAIALELYVKGSLKVFNHRTNVDLQKRLVCFDIKDLGNQLKKIGMLIVQDHVWGRVTENRSLGKSTWYYADEFHLLLKEKQTAAYAVETWKRFRKHGGICTAITQDIKDLLKSYEIENIIENSDFVIMFNQGTGDKNILAERLDISPEQLKYVTGAREGTGLLSYGGILLPFEDHYPKNTVMYQAMTTKLSEVVSTE